MTTILDASLYGKHISGGFFLNKLLRKIIVPTIEKTMGRWAWHVAPWERRDIFAGI
jgi:hypothetical protein